MKMYSFFSAVSLSSLIGSSVAVAANSIDDVVVSATRSEQSEITTPTNITIISRAEIEASGAASLDEVLRGRASIQLRSLYGSSSRMSISMRGFGGGGNAGSNTLILVDGRRINNADLSDSDFSSIALSDIERIEIVQGGGSVLYGSDAVGGVINIITRGTAQNRAEVAVGGGSYGLSRLNANLVQNVDNGWSYKLGAQALHEDQYRDNNAHDLTGALAVLRKQYETGSWFVEGKATDENLNLPASLDLTELAQDRQQAHTPFDYTNDLYRLMRFGWKEAINDHWMLELENSFRSDQGDASAVFFDVAYPSSTKRQHNSLSPRLIGNFPADNGDWIVTLGADVDRSEFLMESTFGPSDSNQKMDGLYAQAVIPVVQSLNATLGGRYGQVENSIDGSDSSDHQTVAEAGLEYQWNADLRSFVRWEQNLRFAKVNENSFTLTGDPLNTQTGDSYELGSEWQQDGWQVSGTLYQLELDNEIDYDPTVGIYGANVNLDPTLRQGVILEAHIPVMANWSLIPSYQFTDAEFDAGTHEGNEIPMVAQHSASLRVQAKLTEQWNWFGEGQYASDRYALNDFDNQQPQLDESLIFHTGASYQMDQWRFTGRVNNLTDEEYAEMAAYSSARGYTEYPMPEINGWLEVSYQFQ